MIKKAIDEGLSRIELDVSGRLEIWNKIQEAERSGVKGYITKTRTRKTPLRVLIAVLILIFALSALCVAAELPSKLMNLFETVNKRVVYDGIEMRIVSAVADDDSMIILYTLKDLEGDRISEYTSIYDFSLSSAATLGTYPVDYDAETKTVTFCMAGDNGNEMKGRKLTLSITSFLDGAPMELRETKLRLYDLLQEQFNVHGEPGFRDYNAAEEDSFWNAPNQKGSDLREKIKEEDRVPVLLEGSMNIRIPGVDWVTVTNIGYKDGWLHVRVKYDDERGQINHGYICLTDSEGNELDNAILNTPLPDGCEEFIIDVGSEEELADVYLAGVFTNYDSLNTGEWEATFKVKGVETKSFACTVETDSVTIDRIVLSPLGVTVYGKGEPDDDPVQIRMKDGTDIKSEGFSRSGDGETGEFECKYKFAAPLDIQAIDSIDLAGQTVTVRN
ncbi:MAG TPA: DUF4179 domain-containing protein [Anaerovoracaceae bacterium]|nr:DUF4179 domain-containing protein [Anaerovoracaceae bacterium]